MFSERRFEFDGRAPLNVRNRNPLLGLGIGADGLKTGHTREAGYGLVGSAKQGDRRVIFVLSGIDNTQRRAQESEAIVNWAFRQFSQREVAPAGKRLAEAEVWMGAEPVVGLVPASDMTALLPALTPDRIPGEIVYTGPVRAPVSEGQHLADLVLSPEGLPEIRLPLVAQSDVARGGFMSQVTTAAKVLMRRFAERREAAM